MSEFSKVSLISVSFVNFTVLVRRRVALHSDCSIDSIEAPYNIYDCRQCIRITLDGIDDLNPILHKEALHFPTKSISVNAVTSI